MLLLPTTYLSVVELSGVLRLELFFFFFFLGYDLATSCSSDQKSADWHTRYRENMKLKL
jgi:hypothetical protein